MSAPFPPSLWAEVTPERFPEPPLTGPVEADLVVIGGGFTGLSTAIHAVKDGASVVLLEANAVGWGASGRNNGQVIPTLTAAEPDALVARFGAAGERLVQLIGHSASVLFDLVRAEGIEAEAEQTGWFQPAHSPGRIKLSEKRVAAWRRHGFPAELIDRRGAAALLGTDFWYGGMRNPTGGHINPLALARGMACAAERHGVQLYEGTSVDTFEREGERWRVTTRGANGEAAGAVRAKAMVLATNAYTGSVVPKLAPRLARSIVPVHSWQVASEPVSANVRATIVPGREAVSDTRGDLRFFRFDARNRLITGGAALGPFNQAERVRSLAARRLGEAFPQLGEPRITHVWNGYLSMNWERVPRIHTLGPNAWTWIGCNGRGVALSVSLGRELAAAALGAPPETRALPLSPVRPLPLHAAGKRIAPYYLAWLKRKDRIEPKV